MHVRMHESLFGVFAFMERNVSPDQLVAVAQTVATMAPLLWGHYATSVPMHLLRLENESTGARTPHGGTPDRLIIVTVNAEPWYWPRGAALTYEHLAAGIGVAAPTVTVRSRSGEINLTLTAGMAVYVDEGLIITVADTSGDERQMSDRITDDRAAPLMEDRLTAYLARLLPGTDLFVVAPDELRALLEDARATLVFRREALQQQPEQFQALIAAVAHWDTDLHPGEVTEAIDRIADAAITLAKPLIPRGEGWLYPFRP